ncbi:MAG: D-amino acid dehydrogenase [Betaproteobacteria bacterium]|nr:MAG: D-amino acid dehydrogenase [Betaproteobacteria bacterium]
MKVLVLGAGVVGVTSAWYLAKAGHEVTVIDRESAAGLETSFANGGQISVGQAEPWANPGAPAKIIKWLGREDAPLMFRMRADLRQWSWGLRFLFECLPWRTRANTLRILRLAIYSRARLQALRRETGIEYDHLTRGILRIHTDQKDFEAARNRLRMLLSYGLAVSVRSPAEVNKIEPALRDSEVRIVGGIYAADDESGDAFLFSQRLAELASKEGVSFGYNVEIERLLNEGDVISGVAVRAGGRKEVLSADAYVVSMASYSPFLLSPVGVRVPVYPVKGYSITAPVKYDSAAPSVCITDESGKVGMTRLGENLRMAGTAELSGYDASISEARCAGIANRVRQILPNAVDYSNVKKWAGLRPATPSNVPLIGRTRYSNLYLNTGHGTLGWTLACGSGAAVADLISQRSPEVEFPFQ